MVCVIWHKNLYTHALWGLQTSPLSHHAQAPSFTDQNTHKPNINLACHWKNQQTNQIFLANFIDNTEKRMPKKYAFLVTTPDLCGTFLLSMKWSQQFLLAEWSNMLFYFYIWYSSILYLFPKVYRYYYLIYLI